LKKRFRVRSSVSGEYKRFLKKSIFFLLTSENKSDPDSFDNPLTIKE